jgi:hypothetical protein
MALVDRDSMRAAPRPQRAGTPPPPRRTAVATGQPTPQPAPTQAAQLPEPRFNITPQANSTTAWAVRGAKGQILMRCPTGVAAVDELER